MEENGTLSRHFWMIQGMARSMDLNLTAAVKAGAMSRAEFADTIMRCCACEKSAECLQWMATQGAGATAPPEYCAIKPALEALRGPA